MKARPILMHGRSIRSLLAGRKTQTRRICKDQSARSYQWVRECPTYPEGSHFTGWAKDCGFPFWLPVPCPYGHTGDLLYVRETWRPADGVGNAPGSSIAYRADWPDADAIPIHWKPSIHMPRWASRITLHLTAVRVERVQEISDDDILAEGVRIPAQDDGAYGCHVAYRRAMSTLWEDTNGAGAWDRNQWVWVLCFEVIEANVDDVLADPTLYGIGEAA